MYSFFQHRRVWLSVLSAVALFLAYALVNAAESVPYNPVSREVVEARLKKYSGNDKQREDTLKQMFAEVGCDDQHLTEQGVKGSQLPNVVCILPGNSEKVIIVG